MFLTTYGYEHRCYPLVITDIGEVADDDNDE